MLSDAAEIVAGRQASKKTPRTHADYRELLAGKRPRHRPDRHARPLARPADDRRGRGGGRRLCPETHQRGRGRRGRHACRRPSTRPGRASRHPAQEHAAPDRGPRSGRQPGPAGKSRTRRTLLLLSHEAEWEPRAGRSALEPRLGRVDRPAPFRPFYPFVHPRGWRAFMEYGNGIVGDMCIHMYDAARWMLGVGWPKRISSSGGSSSTRRAWRTSAILRPPRSIMMT